MGIRIFPEGGNILGFPGGGTQKHPQNSLKEIKDERKKRSLELSYNKKVSKTKLDKGFGCYQKIFTPKYKEDSTSTYTLQNGLNFERISLFRAKESHR